MMRTSFYPTFAAAVLLIAACGKDTGVGGATSDAMPATQAANAKLAQELDFNDRRDFEDARRGFIAKPSGKIMGADGKVLIDFDAFDFVKGPAPATVNPSLWRHAILNAGIGLFKVTEGIYQLRGFDIGQHDADRGQERLDRRRYAHQPRKRRRRAGFCAQAARRQAGLGDRFHAQPHRPLRRRARRHLRRRKRSPASCP